MTTKSLNTITSKCTQSLYALVALSAWVLMPTEVGAADKPAGKKVGLFGIADASVFLRYRLELVDQDGLSENATASTMQTLLAVKTGNTNGFEAFAEFRNVTNIGSENYNNTINGRTQYPVVADPESTDVDQAYLAYTGLKDTKISFGRQKLVWGNKRFVSKLAWRQNQRSFDGLFLESKLAKGFELKYTYAFNVNRAFTDNSPIGNFDGNFHLANLSYDVAGFGKLTGYGYSLDMGDAFSAALSTRTVGANFTGSRPVGSGVKVGYLIEAAHQRDIGSNPFDIGVGYFRAEPSLTVGDFKLRAGYEVLGGNGIRGFQTPFALLHAYNGWADKFLSTPSNGLRDKYAEIKYRIPEGSSLSGTAVTVAYHQFDSDVGDIKYGAEWDAAISKKLFGRVTALAKVAFYSADGFATDTTKVWFQLVTKF